MTQSITEYGFGIITEPIYLLSLETSTDVICEKISVCLSKSKTNVKFHTSKEKVEAYQKNVLQNIQEKSFKDLYKTSKGCMVEMKNNSIYIKPYKLINPSRPENGLIYDENNIKEFSTINFNIEITQYIIHYLNN